MLPRIIAWLGYDPFPKPTTVGGEIISKRRRMGISRKQLAKEIGIDESILEKCDGVEVRDGGGYASYSGVDVILYARWTEVTGYTLRFRFFANKTFKGDETGFKFELGGRTLSLYAQPGGELKKTDGFAVIGEGFPSKEEVWSFGRKM